MNSFYDKCNINFDLGSSSFLLVIGRKIPNFKSTMKNSKSRKKLTNFSRAEVNG